MSKKQCTRTAIKAFSDSIVGTFRFLLRSLPGLEDALTDEFVAAFALAKEVIAAQLSYLAMAAEERGIDSTALNRMELHWIALWRKYPDARQAMTNAHLFFRDKTPDLEGQLDVLQRLKRWAVLEAHVKKQRYEWLAEAMLIVRDHPDWSDRKIANEVGKAASTLTRSDEYRLAAAMARKPKVFTKGHITVDADTGLRDVEAHDETGDPSKMDWDDE